jgi:hypothetical protein
LDRATALLHPAAVPGSIFDIQAAGLVAAEGCAMFFMVKNFCVSV